MIPQNPLDVLAQHLVSMAALDEWEVDEVERLVTAAEPFHELSREQLENVLDMLDGRYPSDRFAELRPRIVWDRTEGTIHGRKGARQLVVTNAGTIPDRGLYGVHLPDGRRVGELDEEMVYEARPGQTFLLGATHLADRGDHPRPGDRHPRARRPRRGPLLEGRRDRPPGRARPGDRRLRPRGGRNREPEELAEEYDLDQRAAENLVAYLREQQAATRVVPSDETIVVERFRDEIGDWRLCVLSPYGGRVHAAWGLALAAKIRDERDLEADAIWSDDGIVIHLPDADEPPPADLVLIEPDEIEDLVVGELSGSALFGARFRENAARSLLIPRAYPGKRTPLWQQRLEVAEPARGRPGLPPLPGRSSRPTASACATSSTCPPSASCCATCTRGAQPGRGRDADRLAVRLLAALRLRRHLHVRGGHAERRAARGGARARPRPAARAARPGGAARADRPRGAGRGRGRSSSTAPRPARAGDRDALQQILRNLGDLTAEECDERVAEGYSAESMLEKLVAERRVGQGPDRRRGALHRRRGRRPLPRRARRAGRPGLPETFLEEHPDAMRALVRRYARTHGPFPTAQLAERYGVDPLAGAARARGRRRRWSAASSCPAAPSASGATPTSCAGCAAPASPACARRSRPPTRRELARFLPSWQNVDAYRRSRRRPRPPARGAGAAAGGGADAEGLGARRAAAPPRRLLADLARRALHQRRAGLDRRRRRSAATTAASPSTSARTSGSPARRRPTRSWSRPEGEVHDAIRERLAAGPSLLARPRRRAREGRRRGRGAPQRPSGTSPGRAR